MLVENQPAGAGGKQGEIDPNGAEFHRSFTAVKLKHHFAKIKVVAHLAAKNLEMDRVSVKLFQCRRHVLRMHQKRFVRFGHGLAIDPLNPGQRYSGPQIKLVQRESKRKNR